MAAVYLETHPPARRQFRTKRRAEATGAIVVHTAESMARLALPDEGAEVVAAFISRRTDSPGSYHSVVDSDSIVRVGEYSWEMFHEGTGGNRWSLGLSFACRAVQWETLPKRWVDGALRNGAKEAANMARWVAETRGIAVPARRLTPEQYRDGLPGFIGHGELDPERRYDPGIKFSWTRFLKLYEEEMGQTMAEVKIPVNVAIADPPSYTIADFGQIAESIEMLYFTYRNGEQPQEEMGFWRALVAQKLAGGEDVTEDLKFLQWALANPEQAAQV